MKLWLITRKNDFLDWDTYDSAVIAADTEEKARAIHPDADYDYTEGDHYRTWVLPEEVNVEYIGEAKQGTEAGVICASFNAG